MLGTRSLRLSPGSLLVLIELLLFIVSPNNDKLPVAAVSFVGFGLAQLIWPSARFQSQNILCPSNFATFIFWIQLVLLPLVVLYHGFSIGTLPRLPSEFATNCALALGLMAYFAYCAGYARSMKRIRDGSVSCTARNAFTANAHVIVIYLAVGLAGLALYHRSLAGYVQFVSDPLFGRARDEDLGGTLTGAITILLRPFFSFALIFAWSSLLGRQLEKSRRYWIPALATVGLLIVVTAANFSYNRGSMVAPILGIAAAFSVRVRRLSGALIALLGISLLVVGILFGTYRGIALSAGTESPELAADLSDTAIQSEVVQDTKALEFAQVYGVSPQFPGYFVEEGINNGAPYWGTTIISSILYPFPVVGKPFRETSGVSIYNRLIYGDDTADQVPPLTAEIYLNWLAPGVVLVYVLLGFLVARIQRYFDNASSAVECYFWFVVNLWIWFPGSIAVTSQQLLYTFWPIYILFLLRRWGTATPWIRCA